MTIMKGTTEDRNQVQFITTTEQENLLEKQSFHGNMFLSRRRRRCGRKGEQLSGEINSYTTRSWLGILKIHKRENGECKNLQNLIKKMFIFKISAILASLWENKKDLIIRFSF